MNRLPRLLIRALVVAAVCVCAVSATARAATIQTFQVPTAGSDLNTITAGPDGNLYFTESQDTTADGQSLFHIGQLTTGGQLTEIPVPFGESDSTGDRMGPTSIVSSGGKLWFLSDVGGSLYTLAPGATSVALATTFGFSDNGEQLAPAPGGGVWMTTEPGDEAGLIASDGTSTFQSINSSGVPGTVVENPSGGIDYDNGGNSINYIDASGNTASYPLPSSVGAGDVYAMVFDGAGDLWYSAYNYSDLTGGFDGTIGVIRPGQATAQTVVTMAPGSGRGPFATDLALGPDGGIWFTWTSTPDGTHAKMPSGIGRVDPTTGQIQYADTVQSNSLVPSSLAFGGDGNLYFLDNQDNLAGRVVSPATVFSGGGPTNPTDPTNPTHPISKPKRAPTVTLAFARQRLKTVRAHRRLRATCTLAGAGTCRVSASVTAKTARHLHLKVAKKAKTVTLASASRTLKKRGKVTLTLHLSKQAARALKHTRKLTLSVKATSTLKGATATSVRRTLTLK